MADASQIPQPPRRMHVDEIEVDVPLVRALLMAQFPHWANLPIQSIPSGATVNALFRLGDELVVRLPRIHWGMGEIEKDFRWLPKLAPLLPLKIPVPVALGEADAGYPWPWAVYFWLEGQDATVGQVDEMDRAAVDLAGFINALHRVDLPDGPPSGRGQRLCARAEGTAQAIEALGNPDFHLGHDIDILTEMWSSALHLPPWGNAPVWTHGDLIPTNLLIASGQLSAIIDFGGLGMGDPACDLVPAWSFLTKRSRPLFRSLLGVDEITWQRGRGWALSQALQILPYYWHTNPPLVSVAKRVLDEIMLDSRPPG